jgi:beta-fructofuranosidase
VQALPRVLALAPGGALHMRPAPEMEALRGESFEVDNLDLVAGEHYSVPLEDTCLEVQAQFAKVSGSCSLRVRASPGEDEVTVLSYDALTQQLSIDTTRSSLAAGVERGVSVAPLELDPDEGLRLHVFLDRSVLEVFANDRVCLTSRIYPSRPDSGRVHVTAAGSSTARLRKLTAWRMKSIWPHQHTA